MGLFPPMPPGHYEAFKKKYDAQDAAIKAAGFRDAVHVHGGVSAWVRQIDPSLPAY